MKIVNMRFMAMLVLGFLPIATKALNCSSPPVPATRAWVDNITSGSDSGCTVVNGDLHLGRRCTAYNACYGGSASLEGAVDLGAVETITGRLTCWGNPNITTVTANNLTNAGAVKISYTKLSGTAKYNTLLTGFSFPALVNVSGAVYGGGVYIWYNAALTSMDLGALKTVEGYLRIGTNAALTSMGLGALQTVGGKLYIGRNPALTSMGLGALQTVGGFLDIQNNAALTFMGLGALQTVEGYLYIGNNNALTSMNLGALQTVEGFLNIKGNDVLASMGLGALQTVVGDLYIYDNMNPLDIEVNEKSPVLGCVDSKAMPCPGVVLSLKIRGVEAMKAWLESTQGWTQSWRGVEARTQTPFTTEANSAPTQAPLATEASSAPSCISFSLVLVPILAVWAMVVQA